MRVALGGAGFAVVGSLMPWVTLTTIFGRVSVNGVDGDGKFSLFAALVFAGLYFGRQLVHLIGAIAAGVIVFGLGLYHLFHVSSGAEDITEGGLATAQVGVGLWFVMLGGGAMLVSLWARR